jgi:serine/threonine protein phosphatase 1
MRHFIFGKRKPQLRDGVRIYAIGDVHGCFNLLGDLIQRIEEDSSGRDAATSKIIILGDMVDRGPRSADVCRLLYTMRDRDEVICLKGNHEQTMLDVLDGNLDALRFWLSFGGVATLASWGVDTDLIKRSVLGESQQRDMVKMFRELVPTEISDWLASLPLYHLEDDYLFVHAGIKPGVALESQTEDDLLWIREPFLSSWRQHPAFVVHGHSESDMVSLNSNRVGIDTAAYRTGRLTALGIEKDQRWTLNTLDQRQIAFQEPHSVSL